MTSIPLFEALQNEQHRKMGCAHIGCFNDKAAAHNKQTAPSTWQGGFYGFLCEGEPRIDSSYISVIGSLLKKSRNGSEKEAASKGEGLLDLDEIQSATQFGNGVDDVKQLSRDIKHYLTATPAEKEALEQVLSHTYKFNRGDDLKHFVEVLSRMKNGEFDPKKTRELVSGIGRAYRTGSDGFNEEGYDGVVFPEKLYNDPEGFEWETPEEFRSARWGKKEDFAFDKKDLYR